MSSSGGDGNSNWQPPSWTSSTSESSLFGNPADDGWGSEDTEQPADSGAAPPAPQTGTSEPASTSPQSQSPAPTQNPAPTSPGPASYSGAGDYAPPPTGTGVDPFAPTSGVQPSYDAGYGTDAYAYTANPAGYPDSSAGAGTNNTSTNNTGTGNGSVPSADDAGNQHRSLFQINLGGSNSSSRGSNSGPSGAIASGAMSLVVAIFFGRVAFFHTFIWLFIVIGAIGAVRTLISKRGNPKANRICGGVGLALCIAAAVVLIVEPQSGPNAFWLFKLWSGSH